jgi:RimJ/RimL family protein N-acetyltransferase
VAFELTAPVELRTARTRLRSYQRSDLAALVDIANDETISAMTLRIPFPYTSKHAEDFFAYATARCAEGHAIFALEFESRLAGTVGLHPEPQHRRAELGYFIGRPFWGRGLATEAISEVLRWAFEERGFNRIAAGVFPENAASKRVLQKLGFTLEGVLRQHHLKADTFKDDEHYSLLAEEWRRRNRRAASRS